MTEENDGEVKILERIKPNAAKQTVEQYLIARATALTDEHKKVLGLDMGDESMMFMELMFRNEYWRSRHEAIEGSLIKFVRHYLAAFCVLRDLLPDESEVKIKAMVAKKLGTIPEDLETTPEV